MFHIEGWKEVAQETAEYERRALEAAAAAEAQHPLHGKLLVTIGLEAKAAFDGLDRFSKENIRGQVLHSPPNRRPCRMRRSLPSLHVVCSLMVSGRVVGLREGPRAHCGYQRRQDV